MNKREKDIKAQREELMRLIMDAMTVESDESENTQVVNIDDIHGCNTDFIDTQEPDLTLEQIQTMLHLNDPDLGNTTSKGENTDLSDLTDDNGLSDDNVRDNTQDNAPDNKNNKGRQPQSTINDYGQPADAAQKDVSAGATDKTGKDGNEKKPWQLDFPQDTPLDDVINAIINDDKVGAPKAIIEFA